jgi:hypothetical protein
MHYGLYLEDRQSFYASFPQNEVDDALKALLRPGVCFSLRHLMFLVKIPFELLGHRNDNESHGH